MSRRAQTRKRRESGYTGTIFCFFTIDASRQDFYSARLYLVYGKVSGRLVSKVSGSDFGDRRKTGAEAVVDLLRFHKVEVIFGYPGGAVLPLYDALFSCEDIRHILVRQEGGAVHAAEGYARSSGKIGVALVTSGPGATNAVTGLTDALMDSVPLVCLSGQVATHLIGNDAFQEADTTGITRSCTKHNYLVRSREELCPIVHEAFALAKSGRPGPILVDLPKDVLQKEGSFSPPTDFPLHRRCTPRPVSKQSEKIEAALDLLAGAERPIVYAGGGVINSGVSACRNLRRLVHTLDIPCTLTLMGLGGFPADDPLFLGMLGMHGSYQANLAMYHCDVMLNVGARFDDRVTGRLDAFSPGSKKIHIDIDPSSINKNVRSDLSIVGDAGQVLGVMLQRWKEDRRHMRESREWTARIQEWRDKRCFSYVQKEGSAILPQYAIERLYQRTRKLDPIVSTEVGQHQMWAAQYFRFQKPVSLADFRRTGNDGLWFACGGRSAVRTSRGSGDRRCGRGLHSDEHPGAFDGGTTSFAGQGFHHQQSVDGDGSSVAGAFTWLSVCAQLYGVASGLREACGGIRRGWSSLRETGGPGRCNRRDAFLRKTGRLRLPGGKRGELLSDDSSRSGTQRDVVGPYVRSPLARKKAGRSVVRGSR